MENIEPELRPNGELMTFREFMIHQVGAIQALSDMEIRLGDKIDAMRVVHTNFRVHATKQMTANGTKIESVEDNIDKLKLWDRALGVVGLALGYIGIKNNIGG